jgi:hypothetical protein
MKELGEPLDEGQASLIVIGDWRRPHVAPGGLR